MCQISFNTLRVKTASANPSIVHLMWAAQQLAQYVGLLRQ